MEKEPNPLRGDDEVTGTRWVQLLGGGVKPKILLALLAQRHYDLNKSDIAKSADVSRKTVHRHLSDLVDLGVINQTRVAGSSPMYQFDADSEIGAALLALDHSILRAVADDVDATSDAEN